jgi:Putative auto-transporter adhesin, head GIN domain
MKFLLNLLLCLSLVSCTLAQRGVKGSGTVTTENRPVSDFSKLELSGVFNVVIAQGSENKVSVETDDNLQELVTIENNGSTLIAKNKRGSRFRKSTKMNVYITYKNITDIKNTLVGNLSSSNLLAQSSFNYKSSAVGNTDLKLEVSTLNIDISTVGNTKIEGKATTCDLNNSSVGNYIAGNLIVEEMALHNSAVGNTTYHAKKVTKRTGSPVGKSTNKYTDAE